MNYHKLWSLTGTALSKTASFLTQNPFSQLKIQCSHCRHGCASYKTAQYIYVKKPKHSRDSLKINTFPCGTVDWLIGAVRNRSETKQSLYQRHTGKKKPESCGNATVGESCGTGSRRRRSSDSQIPNTYTRSQAALDDVKTKALCFSHHSANDSKASPSRSAYYWWRRQMVSFIIQRVNISKLSPSKMDILKRRQRETDGKPIR